MSTALIPAPTSKPAASSVKCTKQSRRSSRSFAASVDVDTTVGVEPDKAWFRILVVWTQGVSAASEPWDRVFNFSLSNGFELCRTMAGDFGLKLAERMWIELCQFERPTK